MTILSANISYGDNNEPVLVFIDGQYNTNSLKPGDAGYDEAVAVIVEKCPWLAPVFADEREGQQ